MILDIMLTSGIGVFSFLTQNTIKTCSNLFSAMSRAANTPLPSQMKALNLNSNILQNQQQACLPQIEQQRNYFGYKGRMLLKDIKRRELLRKFAPERVRLQTLRSNWILPKLIKV